MIAFNDKTPHGNVGSRILGNYTITIDRSNQRIAFAPMDSVASGTAGPQRMVSQAGGKQSYGIQMRDVGGEVIPVVGTVAGLPAANAGLRAGDTIVAINGSLLTSMPDEERIKALRSSPLVLLLDREGKEVELTLEFGK